MPGFTRLQHGKQWLLGRLLYEAITGQHSHASIAMVYQNHSHGPSVHLNSYLPPLPTVRAELRRPHGTEFPFDDQRDGKEQPGQVRFGDDGITNHLTHVLIGEAFVRFSSRRAFLAVDKYIGID